MRVSFTGNQGGMTAAQKKAFRTLIRGADIFTHGDCVGSDAQAHQIAVECGVETNIRPCTITHKRAYCEGNTIHDPKPPMDRNTDIVLDGDCLIATPKEFEEVQRSGTWATVRRARRKGKLVYIIWPDGKIERELVQIQDMKLDV